MSGFLANKYLQSINMNIIVFEAKQGIRGMWRETFSSKKVQTPHHAFYFNDFQCPSHVTIHIPSQSELLDYFHTSTTMTNILDCLTTLSSIEKWWIFDIEKIIVKSVHLMLDYQVRMEACMNIMWFRKWVCKKEMQNKYRYILKIIYNMVDACYAWDYF